MSPRPQQPLHRTFPYVSHLRVYEPLDVFDDGQQLAILDQRSRGRHETEVLERSDAVRRLVRAVSDPFPHGSSDLVRVLHYPGHEGSTRRLYCPNQLAVRASLAAESLGESIRGPLVDVLVPEVAREAHAARIDPDSFADSLARLHTRSATWGVPFGWFVLLHEDDHSEVVEDDGKVQTVRLAAPVGQSLERARGAMASLALVAPELDLLDELDELTNWLEVFSEDAVLELDYGPVADLVFPDDSPSDVRLGIESLAEGDMTGAAASYRRLANRWIPIRQLARAS
ncbi:hypothetical protein MUG94_00785 [Arthrobacter gengyunqii]|uniref:DUF8083 domain-containing protein n=1 Tax=Arthrobacter gengyunqii TaxID=2886940 RepID=A0A9X1M1A1_9MICC|nr:hypothetical protein [Arthrobacter gengyunqii]MCC3266282.1 hypothetical protein [Arthrobacter gengyunqii]MCC3268995.1 hypothetical protein [Arthrobacter gengyunqii]UOY96370.1 hypothetical protein MUG94_00785 [Arthrobacter gengyunqii]